MRTFHIQHNNFDSVCFDTLVALLPADATEAQVSAAVVKIGARVATINAALTAAGDEGQLSLIEIGDDGSGFMPTELVGAAG